MCALAAGMGAFFLMPYCICCAQYETGWLFCPPWVSVRQPAGVHLQDRVSQPALQTLWGGVEEKTDNLLQWQAGYKPQHSHQCNGFFRGGYTHTCFPSRLEFRVKKEGWGGGGSRVVAFQRGQGDLAQLKPGGKSLNITIGDGLPKNSSKSTEMTTGWISLTPFMKWCFNMCSFSFLQSQPKKVLLSIMVEVEIILLAEVKAQHTNSLNELACHVVSCNTFLFLDSKL